MNTLKLIFAGVLVSICGLAKAQQAPNRLNLPTVISPSPAAQNFMRYGEIPVDYSTGVPSISVPLYTVKSRQLSLPISISYHGSGIKVADKASVIGLGWVLNAGGIISETKLSAGSNRGTYNAPDSLNAARVIALNSSNVLDAQNFAQRMYNEVADNPAYTSNRFTFSLPGGESGAFRYDYLTGNLIKLPYTPVQISPNNIGSGVALAVPITIIDEHGVNYVYKPFTTGSGMSTTWNISCMISADKTDTIRFVYKSVLNEYETPAHTSALQEYEYPSGYPDVLGIYWTSAVSLNNSVVPSGSHTYEKLLDSIVTSNTVVTFAVTGGRQDLYSAVTTYRVSGMSIFNRQSGSLIKSYDFSQDYFGSSAHNNQRLKLTGITGKGSDNTAIENYSFVYDESVELPPYAENITGADKYSGDYWGYYNGSLSSSLVPIQFTPTVVNNYHSSYHLTVTSDNYTNRNPDSIYAKAAMLKEIHYPTGGKTVFTFEPNRANNAYQYPSGFTVPDIVGGFRIKKISNYSNDGSLTDYKTYTYNPGLTQTIRNDLFAQTQRTFVMVTQAYANAASISGFDYPNLIISSESFQPLTCDNGPPVLYTSVTEYVGGSIGVNSGKIVYTYQTPPTTYNTNAGYDDPQYTGTYFYDMGDYVPLLVDKKVYKYISSGTYMPVKGIHSAYTTFLSQSYPMGYHLVNMNSYPTNSIFYDCWDLNTGGYYNGNYTGTPTGYNGFTSSADLYIAESVSATQQQNMLTQTIEYDYNPVDSTKYVTNTKTYTYGSLTSYTLGDKAHTEPTQTTTTSSKGDTYITALQYPQDYSTTAPYDTLLRRNILTPVIKQLNYKNSTSTGFLNSTTTNYGTYILGSTRIVAPDSIQTKFGSGSNITRIKYDAYDSKGNISTVKKSDGPPVSYLWGYKQAYPIAQVINASAGNIFYQNFEETEGNSTANDSKTGHYSHTGGYSHTVSGLAAGNYNLEYWEKISGVWTWHSSVVTASSGSVSISISNQVDDVRLYPVNAQMITSTYDPNIGQTSSTDTKGETTYYEYDNYQRLKNVKDKDGNIVKHNDYNYAH